MNLFLIAYHCLSYSFSILSLLLILTLQWTYILHIIICGKAIIPLNFSWAMLKKKD